MAKTQLPEPDETYVLDLKSSLQLQFAQQDEDIDKTRRVRMLEESVPIPPELSRVGVEVRDPTVTDEIQRVVSTLTLNPPKVTITPVSSSDSARANATLRKEWTEQVLVEAGNRIQGRSTLTDIVDAAIGDGGACWKVLYDTDVWEERLHMRKTPWIQKYIKEHPDSTVPDDPESEPTEAIVAYNDAVDMAKRAAGPPITWLSVDIRTVYPVWSGTKITAVVETNKRPTLTTLREHGLAVARDDDGRAFFFKNVGLPLSPAEADFLGPDVEWTEYWDDTWCCYMLSSPAVDGGGYIIDVFKHGYGRVPYFFSFGLMPNQWKNRKVGWGVSRSKRWLVEFRSFLYTLLANAAAQDVGTPLVDEETDPGDNVNPTNRPLEGEVWTLNSIIAAEPGHRIHPVFDKPVAQSFNELLHEVSELISKLDTPRVNSEIGSGLEGAGFAISQILLESRTRHHPFVQNIERALVDTTRFIWWLVKHKIKDTVYVQAASPGGQRSGNWLGLGPNDLTDGVGVTWRMDPDQPSAQMIDANYWGMLVERGFASKDMAMIALGFEPDKVRMEIALDELRNEPWFKAYRRQQALQSMSRGDILEDQAKNTAQTGQVPGMAPPGMMGPPPGPPQIAPPNGSMPPSPMPPGGLGPHPTPAGPPGPPAGFQGAPMPPAQSAMGGVQTLQR